MGTSAGPNLAGIGRGGDSNLVLEMDAHDAKSYPGEPTENLLSSSAMDFSVLSAYTGSTFTRVADGESPTGYACEMYYTGTVNTSARCLFGTNNGNMPTSGSAFVSVWVKRTAGPSTLMRPAYFAGNSWHVMPPLDGGSAYMTSEYRPFGYNGTVGTASGGPNPGFSMTSGGNSTSSDKTRWIMPQFTTKTYATPFVREGNGGTGTYNARPASVNLMIHGNVGPDTVAGSNNPNVLSEALSKFETSSGWTVGQDWSINSGTEVAEITSWTQASFLQRAASPAEVIEGGRYVIKGDVTTSNAGTLYARVGNSSYAVLPTGTGSTVEVVCGSTATETVLFYSGGWEGTIDNVSVAPLAVMKDSSPSKHAITTVGDTTHSAAQSKFSGGSIYFDGTGDYLRTAAADFLDGSWTVDCWFYYDGSFPGTIEGLIALDYDGASGSSNNAMNFGVTNGAMALLISSNVSSGWNLVNATGGTVSASAWHHAAAVFDGSTYKSYLDGVQVTSNASATAVASQSSSQIIVGTTADASSGQSWNGYIDEVRVTTGTALWTSAFTPPTRRNLSAPVVDRSGNHNGINLINGTDSGGETYRVGEVIEPIDTAVWDFDGTDDYAIAGDSDDWNFGTEPFAIEQWLYFTDFTPSGDVWSCALQQYAAEADRNGWMLFYNNGSSGLEWRLECTAPTPSFYPANVSLSDLSLNTWHLFTITREGSNFKMYIDGVLRGTDTSNPTFTNIAGPMYVGNYAAGDPHEFQGQMGALRIYKGGALSDEQVKENFNQQSSRFNVLNWANNAIVQNGLDLWLDAGDRGSYPGTGSTWYDLTSNNYNGTIANAVYNGGYGNGSFTFDGSGDTVDVGPISTAGDHSNCTISIWMNKAAQVANYGNVYDCNYGATTYNKGPRMEVDIAGSVVRVYMGSDAGNYVSISFGGLSNDVWYNLVLTVEPNSTSQDLKSYTDGALVSSYTSSSSYVWDGDVADLYLGVGYTAGRHFTGKIAAFELYNRVLSADEIAQNFTVQRQRFGV